MHEKWKWSRSVVSNSSRPHGLQPTRLLHPWDFPGESTGVGCHCLLWKKIRGDAKAADLRTTKSTLTSTLRWWLPLEKPSSVRGNSHSGPGHFAILTILLSMVIISLLASAFPESRYLLWYRAQCSARIFHHQSDLKKTTNSEFLSDVCSPTQVACSLLENTLRWWVCMSSF